MSLVSCNGCGVSLSTEAISCPMCDMMQRTPDVCPECYALVNDSTILCNRCGHPIKPDKVKVYVDPAYKDGKRWGALALVSLMIVTLVAPIVGFVAGLYGITKDSKRSQGAGLLIESFFVLNYWLRNYLLILNGDKNPYEILKHLW